MEIVSLKAGDIDRTGEVWTAEIRDHKTSYRGKKRFLYFGPKSQAILQKYLDRKPEAFLFSPAEAEQFADRSYRRIVRLHYRAETSQDRTSSGRHKSPIR
jgi:site-specific recombinase XerD